MPSERVIVPSVPVTPAPAVTGPLTGGQYVAQLPLQFDVVLVSGTNQYNVSPAALVSTVAPPMVVVFSAGPELPEPDPLDPLDTAGADDALEQAPATSAIDIAPIAAAYFECT